MIEYTPPRPVESLPVIDLSQDAPTVALAMRRACLDTGFFYVVQHGVAPQLIDAAFQASRQLFDLEDRLKLQLLQSQSFAKRGYEPPGTQVLDDGSPADNKESFRFGRDPGPEHPYVVRRLPTYGPNQWPPSLPGIVAPLMDYLQAVTALGDRVLSMLALSLELDPDFFRAYYRSPMATVRLLKYPPHPAQSAFNLLGAGAHTDWGGITLLAQDPVGGLEVRNVAGEWVEAKPVADSFVINLGEMMARWTNGLYQSNLHRVRNNSSSQDRYSMACFYDPDYDSRIACIESCLAPGALPLYAACTSGEHIAEMHRRTTSQAKAAPSGGLIFSAP